MTPGPTPSERFPLAWALLYAAGAVALFFPAVWVAASALGPAEDHRIWVAGIALAFYSFGVPLTLSAGSVLRSSAVHARLVTSRAVTSGVSTGALGAVLPAFVHAAGTEGRAFGAAGSVPLTALAALALAIGLSWLMALRIRTGALAAVALFLAFVAAALAIPPAP